jgi:hypothetical protein
MAAASSGSAGPAGVVDAGGAGVGIGAGGVGSGVGVPAGSVPVSGVAWETGANPLSTTGAAGSPAPVG